MISEIAMRRVLFALLSLTSYPTISARGPAPGEPSPSALESLGIPSDYAVRYVDEHDNPIARSEFYRRSAAQPFNIAKDKRTHTATLKLMTPSESAAAAEALAHPSVGVMVGKPFPPFAGLTLRGERLDSSRYQGKTTLINFFFAMCGPCIQETPVLSAFHSEHPDVEVLAVTYDDAATASAFAKRHGFNWPILSSQQALADLAHVTMYPTMVLIGPDGIVKKAANSGSIAAHGQPLTAERLAEWMRLP